MKTILLPTDFSENSQMAAEFAIHNLQEKDTTFVLLHVYDIPRGGTSGLFYLLEELRNQGLKGIADFKTLLDKKHKAQNLKIETDVLQGNFADQTAKLAKEINADCTVVGTKGSSGIKEVLVGSNTLQLMKTTEIPLYIIPENYKSLAFDKVILTYDGNKIDSETTKEVNYFAKKHKLPLELLHVRLKEESPVQNWDEVKSHFVGIDVDIHECWGESLEEGLQKGTENSEGIMVMTYRKKSFWERFFNISDSRKAVMHAKLPMLIVPEK